MKIVFELYPYYVIILNGWFFCRTLWNWDSVIGKTAKTISEYEIQRVSESREREVANKEERVSAQYGMPFVAKFKKIFQI